MNHGIPPAIESALAALGLAVLLVGCGAPFSSPEGAGGAGGGGGVTVTGSTSTGASLDCDANHACGQGYFCFDAACGLQGAGTGTCQPVETTEAKAAPVCGCDGVTYWNSRLGAASPHSIRADGACPAGEGTKGCSTSGGCAAEAGERCAYARDTCSSALGAGTCWVVPASCSETKVVAKRCEGGSQSSCAKLCDLITSGKAFHDVNGCAL
jgi:hypothetical protein